MSQNMSRAEREEFLAGLHVGVLAVALAATPNGSNWPAGTWGSQAATPTSRPTPAAPRS